MKVLFLAAYSDLAAASRIKVYQFLPLFERKGIKCKVICFTPSFLYRLRLASENDKKLLLAYYPLSNIVRLFKTIEAILSAPKFDIVFINEPIIPLGLEKLLKLVNKNLIFQFSDAVFIGKQPGENFFKKLRSRALFNCWKRLATASKCCLADNDYTKSAVLKFCPNAEKMTGPMDTSRYFIREDKKEGNNIVIGWIGSPFTTKYLYTVKEALKELSKKYNIILRLVGAKKDFRIDGVKFEIKEWEINTEIPWLTTFNIGIMPLTDDQWTKGKAAYKVLQYMSMGIPSVASSVGFNKELIKDGVNGFLAGGNEEWVKKISALIEDKNLREEMGKNARITIEEDYSLGKAFEKLLKIFENTLSLKM